MDQRRNISQVSASNRCSSSLSCPYPFAATSIPCPRIREEKTYPTILEQPVVWKFGVVRVHLDRECADISYLQMQGLNLLFRERVAALFWVDSSVVQNFIWNVVKQTGNHTTRVEPSPATQFPTPALKDWSSKRALIGHVLLSTPLLKSAMSGMDKMGSNPISEMGGSASGVLHKRIRPSLRASRKATSVTSPLSLEAGPI